MCRTTENYNYPKKIKEIISKYMIPPIHQIVIDESCVVVPPWSICFVHLSVPFGWHTVQKETYCPIWSHGYIYHPNVWCTLPEHKFLRVSEHNFFNKLSFHLLRDVTDYTVSVLNNVLTFQYKHFVVSLKSLISVVVNVLTLQTLIKQYQFISWEIKKITKKAINHTTLYQHLPYISYKRQNITNSLDF
jgi:hypothetical protein